MQDIEIMDDASTDEFAIKHYINMNFNDHVGDMM